MADESSCVGHEPCPSCGSRNNLARYSDGHGFCFGCQHYEHAATGAAPTATPRKTMSGNLVEGGEVRALVKRGITEETCKHWRYQIGEHHGKPVQVANYCDATGVVIAQKIRGADKTFTFLGEPKKAGLYGQWLWRDGGKMLVITEGEIDALTVSQLQNNKWPVVSVPNGAAGAAKSIAKQIEWVEKFDKVVFMFDDDEPGRAAATECAEMLTPGKAYVARIAGFKDANEALQAGQGPRVITAMWEAKEYRPDGVVDVDSLAEEATKPIALGTPWPWPQLTAKTYGIRRREVYGFGAGTGVGKSDLFKEVMLHLIKLGQPVGCVALEEHPAHTLKVLAGKSVSKRLHLPGVDVPAAEVRAAIETLNNKVFFYNHFGAAKWDTIKDKIKYMVKALGCRDIFLDHLTALAAAMDEDERKAIDALMADLSALAQQLDCTIYFISHLTTPEGKSHEEGGRVLEKHFRGSRSIAYWSHFLFALERDKQDTDGVTVFRVLKDRYTGDAAGLTFGLAYDRETGRYHECELPRSGDQKFTDETTNGEF
jgi:twinkle protein